MAITARLSICLVQGLIYTYLPHRQENFLFLLRVYLSFDLFLL